MGDFIGGDPKSPSAADSAQGVLAALIRNYAGLSQQVQSQMTPFAQSDLATQQATAPGLAKLNADIYNQYAPQYAQTNAQTEGDLIRGAGGQSVLSADALQRQLDPEYYSGRSLASSKLNDLLGGMDPNALTGAEQASVERGLQRQGVDSGQAGSPQSGTSAINAALSYGGALDAKRNTIAKAIDSATQALPNFKTNADIFGQATGRGGTQAFGQNFAGAPSQSGINMGQNVLGMAGNFQQQSNDINSNRRTIQDFTNQGIGSFCCFIFLETYNGQLPWFVRFCRDKYYNEEPRVAEGYRKMAKWLVPLMRKSKIVSKLVNYIMVKPITQYGGYICSVEGYSSGWLFKPFKQLWFSIWRNL